MGQAFLYKNAADFRQKFEGTYGILSANGKKVVVYVSSVSLNSDTAYVSLKTAKGIDYTVNVQEEANDVEFQFIPTKRGWVNTANGPILVQRTPAKQYRAGVCADNTKFQDVLGRSLPVKFEAVELVFQPTDKPDQSKGLALNSYFAVGNKYFWCGDAMCGTASLVGQALNIKLSKSSMLPLIQQELRDAARRNNLTLTLE